MNNDFFQMRLLWEKMCKAKFYLKCLQNIRNYQLNTYRMVNKRSFELLYTDD